MEGGGREFLEGGGEVSARMGVSGSVIRTRFVLIEIFDRANTRLQISDKSPRGPPRGILASSSAARTGLRMRVARWHLCR